MSDARPITNVTEFVCGSCWNSFSRNDEGVVVGANVACPHCGHEQPLPDAAGGGVADLVRNAPTAGDDSDSGLFEYEPLEVSSGFVAGEDGGPGAPPEEGGVRAPGAANTGGARLQVVTGGRRSRSEVSAETLPEGASAASGPQVSRRDTSPHILAAEAEDIEALFGGPGDTTDPEIAPPSAEVLAALTAAMADDDPPAEPDWDTAPTPAPAAASLESGALDDEVEPAEWKIKAPPGLTYNFHSLDAMLGWAANKSGLDMKVSIDGLEWHDFGAFLEAIRAGLSASRALQLAGEGGEISDRIAAITAAPQLSAFDEIQQVDAREQVRRRLADAAGEEISVDGDTVEVAAVVLDLSDDEAFADPEPAPAAPVAKAAAPPPRRPSGKSDAPARSPSANQRRQSGTSRAPAGALTKTPLAPKAKPGLSGATVVVIVLVLAAVAAGALHFSGVFRIPGLPF